MDFRTLTQRICKKSGLTLGEFLRSFYLGISTKIKSGQNYPNPFSHYCAPCSPQHQFQAKSFSGHLKGCISWYNCYLDDLWVWFDGENFPFGQTYHNWWYILYRSGRPPKRWIQCHLWIGSLQYQRQYENILRTHIDAEYRVDFEFSTMTGGFISGRASKKGHFKKVIPFFFKMNSVSSTYQH